MDHSFQSQLHEWYHLNHTLSTPSLNTTETNPIHVVLGWSLPPLDPTVKVKYPHRYMYDTVQERAAVLDQRIIQVGKDMLKYHLKQKRSIQATEEDDSSMSIPINMDDEEELVEEAWSRQPDPATPSQVVVTVWGRICNDVEDHKLSPDSILLESATFPTTGSRTKLLLHALTEPYALFPGEIVGVVGINADGRGFVAQQFLPPPPLPPLPPVPFTSNTALGVMIAAGPFSVLQEEDVSFDPFRELLKQAAALQPHMFILVYPSFLLYTYRIHGVC